MRSQGKPTSSAKSPLSKLPTTRSVPPSLFPVQLWRAMGLEPRVLDCPRALFFPEHSLVMSREAVTKRPRPNFPTPDWKVTPSDRRQPYSSAAIASLNKLNSEQAVKKQRADPSPATSVRAPEQTDGKPYQNVSSPITRRRRTPRVPRRDLRSYSAHFLRGVMLQEQHSAVSQRSAPLDADAARSGDKSPMVESPDSPSVEVVLGPGEDKSSAGMQCNSFLGSSCSSAANSEQSTLYQNATDVSCSFLTTSMAVA